MTALKRLAGCVAGVTSIEYALIAGTVALVLVAVLPGLESALDSQYTTIADSMTE